MARVSSLRPQLFRRGWKSAWLRFVQPTAAVVQVSPGSRLRRSHAYAPRGETLEPRTMLAAHVVISEFLAYNDNGIRDEDYFGRPDWIELQNAGDEAANLAGWFLTDDQDNLDKWQFPELNLEPGARVVVFASGKDRAVAGAPLHTNFKLADDGEYLALVEPDGITVAYDFGDQYPPQLRDVSYGAVQEVVEAGFHATGDVARYLIPDGDQLGLDWTEAVFDDGGWRDGATGLGYSFRTEFDTAFETDVKAEMKGVNPSIYLRLPFDIEDVNGVSSLTLSLLYNDGYAAFLNGVRVAGDNAPDDLTWNATATGRRTTEDSLVATVIELKPFLDLVNPGHNVLAIQGLNSSAGSSRFLIAPQLTALIAGTIETDRLNYFAVPTPGNANGTGSTTAVISVDHNPPMPAASDPLTVTATVYSVVGAAPEVTLSYCVMFGEEMTLPMADDGLHGDGAAGDGVFGGVIPPGTALPGQMIRYRIEAGATPESFTRSPAFQDPLTTQKYWGTVVADPSVANSKLPIMHLFLEDPLAADTPTGSRGALYYNGEFYDNILSDYHGHTTPGPKFSHDVFVTRDHKFLISEGLPRLDDINLLTNYFDVTLLRNTLSYEIYNIVGAATHLAFPIRVQQNGEYYGIYDFVEDGDDEFLERIGLDPRGALYKGTGGGPSVAGLEKKTRHFEDKSDLVALAEGLKVMLQPTRTAAEREELHRFLYDNINIPEMVNFAVALVLAAESDNVDSNSYTYRDSEGTGLWHQIRWDVDKSLGRQGDAGTGATKLFRIEIGQLGAGSGFAPLRALFDMPEFYAMYLRRMRTVFDEFLQPPGTPPDERFFDRRIDELAEQIRPDMPAELARWPERGAGTHWEEQLDFFKNEYWPRRRVFLYGLVGDMDFSGKVDGDDIDDFALGLADPAAYEAKYGVHPSLRGDTDFYTGHVNPSGELIPYETNTDLDFDDVAQFVALVNGEPQRFAALPDAQVGVPQINFGAIDYNPISGNQDEEFIELANPLTVAVEISGWRLEGGVDYTFKTGVVIPPGGSLYVSPNVNAFRARQTGPSGGQALFVQGDYSGHISSRGETIRLVAADGTIVASVTTPSELSLEQAHLRISEIMYHPQGPDAGSAFEGEDFEFIELVNTSTSLPLDLENVAFTRGIEFNFPPMSLAPGEHTVVVRNASAFAERYGDEILVAGQYGGTLDDFKLSNSGERIILQDARGETIHDFDYADSWYPATDGGGASLEIADPSATALDLWGDRESWLASTVTGGTPGSPHSTAAAAGSVGDGPLAGVAEQRWLETVDLVLRRGQHALPESDGYLAPWRSRHRDA